MANPLKIEAAICAKSGELIGLHLLVGNDSLLVFADQVVLDGFRVDGPGFVGSDPIEFRDVVLTVDGEPL